MQAFMVYFIYKKASDLMTSRESNSSNLHIPKGCALIWSKALATRRVGIQVQKALRYRKNLCVAQMVS